MYRIQMTVSEKQKELLEDYISTVTELSPLKSQTEFKKLKLYPTKVERDLDVYDQLVFHYLRDEDKKLTGRTIAVLHVDKFRFVGIYDINHEPNLRVTRKGKKVKRTMHRRFNRTAAIGRAFFAFATDLGMASPRVNEFSFSFDINNVTDDIKKIVPEWMWLSEDVKKNVPEWKKLEQHVALGI